MLGKESWLVHEERLSSIESENAKLRKDLYECLRMIDQCYKRQRDLYDMIRNKNQPKMYVGAPITRDSTSYPTSYIETGYPIKGTASDIKTGIPPTSATEAMRAQQETMERYKHYYTHDSNRVDTK